MNHQSSITYHLSPIIINHHSAITYHHLSSPIICHQTSIIYHSSSIIYHLSSFICHHSSIIVLLSSSIIITITITIIIICFHHLSLTMCFPIHLSPNSFVFNHQSVRLCACLPSFVSHHLFPSLFVSP